MLYSAKRFGDWPMRKRERLEGLIHVRMTREQEGVLRLAAHRQGVTISEYIRQAATEAVRRVAA
jgi:uncharacterized protein (DUF1778 family)